MEYITAISSRTQISSQPTTGSRNGNGIFCSDFTGRNIADTGSGGKGLLK
jgi:hypothetical protein